MADLSNTFMQNNTMVNKQSKAVDEIKASEVLKEVYASLVEKGYNPTNQLVGYIMSGDPTYITGHKNARSIIMKVERDEILEELIENYIETKFKQ